MLHNLGEFLLSDVPDDEIFVYHHEIIFVNILKRNTYLIMIFQNKPCSHGNITFVINMSSLSNAILRKKKVRIYNSSHYKILKENLFHLLLMCGPRQLKVN